MDRISPMAREYLTGSLASSFTAAVFNPLEVTKTHLHLQDMPGMGMSRIHEHGFARALRKIAADDGLALMWRHGLVMIREQQIGGSGGSLEPPGPLS